MNTQAVQEQLRQINEAITLDDIMQGRMSYEKAKVLNERITILEEKLKTVKQLCHRGHISFQDMSQLKSKIQLTIDEAKKAVQVFCKQEAKFL